MVKRIQARDGRVLDQGTGMTRRGVMKGVTGLRESGLGEIEKVTGHTHSRKMFRAIAAALPDEAIFQILSEVKHGRGVRNRGAIFVSAAKKWLQKRKG